MDNHKEHRCKNCRKLFFKGRLHHGAIEIKCKSCKGMNIIRGEVCDLVLREGKHGTYKPSTNADEIPKTLCCNQCQTTLIPHKEEA